MCTYFKTKTDVAKNMIDDFFLTLTVRGPFHRKDFKWKKKWGYGVNFWKRLGLNERVEAAITSYTATGYFSQYVYSMPLTKNH